MWLHSLVYSVLLVRGPVSADPSDLQLIVDLFSQLVGLSVLLEHDFGGGVPLLNGKVKVYMYQSLELLPSSELSRKHGECTLFLKAPQGFRIVTSRDDDTLDLNNCYMEVKYSVKSDSVKPTTVKLHSCQISYLNGTSPKYAGQVLPPLSRALFLAAVRFLSFEGAPSALGLTEAQRIFSSLLYQTIVNG